MFMDRCYDNDGCRIDTSATYMGNPLVVLENRHIRLSVMPEYGAKIFEFIYKPLNYNFMWENSRLRGRKAYYGANYDNFATGGMEDAFPTGLPSNYKGEEIPFFGEIWSVPWKYDIVCDSLDAVSVKFECYCSIYPVRIEKTIMLHKDEMTAVVKYRIENLSNLEMDYIWGVHPSISINTHCRIKVPDMFYNINVCQMGDGYTPISNCRIERFKWPYFNGIDLSLAMDENSRIVLNIYSDPLTEGWLNIFDASKGIGFGMSFDTSMFKILSVWLIYGGWRGHYCLMAEPFTSWPLSLHKAVENGSAVKLKSKEVVETEMSVFISKNKGGYICE